MDSRRAEGLENEAEDAFGKTTTTGNSLMSVSVAFSFPAGRYHATPFGHHVNEGLIEWPPSPWRLLRALISMGYTSGIWNGIGPPAVGRALIEKLCMELPLYRLPTALGAHSRHYMPIGQMDGKNIQKTTLVFDTWARIEGKGLTVTWRDVSLSEAERALLGTLVGRMNYLGRSESWVEGRVLGVDEPIPETNCFPEETRENPGHGWEQVALLAATTAASFEAWRRDRLNEALANLPLPDGRKPSKTLLRKREQAEELYRVDLLDCLQRDTTWWRSQGWNQPPGSRRVFYWRKADAISVGVPRAKIHPLPAPRVPAMLLSLTNVSRNDHALPPMTRSLPQAELLHGALVSLAARRGSAPPELTGCDENGEPLRGPHEHAHINPLDLDGDGHLDHILIWTQPMHNGGLGLGGDAQSAIRSVRRTFTKGGVEALRLALAATGDLDELVRLPGKYGKRMARIAGSATIWQSATPFVPARHVKARGKNTIEGQIRAELRWRRLPEPVAVQQLAPIPRGRSNNAARGDATAGDGRTKLHPFRHFILIRARGPAPPVACGFAIRVTFDQPVTGPIALGYGSHFGLGLFEH